jgi:putative membrane protein
MAAPMIGAIFVLVVGIQHIGFGFLEMFLFNKPIGRKIFRTDEAFAAKAAPLAANQGLYNLFLAAGLLLSFFLPNEAAHYFRFFFMTCVVVAGIYGGITVNKRIALLQAAPAAFGLFFLVLGM